MIEHGFLENHAEIYSKLEKVVGKEYISDDPTILIVHSRDQSPFANLKPIGPEFVVLPESTEQIQEIID